MGMHDGAREVHQQALQCIDMASPDKHALAARVRAVCVSSGFFYVVNHGVDAKLVEEVFAQSRKFFSLPTEEKLKMLHDKNYRGYTPFGSERFDPTASKPDLKESYALGVHVPESHPNSSKPLHAPNKYPPQGLVSNLWCSAGFEPLTIDLLPGWQESIDEYHNELTKLAFKIARLIALALRVEETYFEKPGIIDDALIYMRLVHYSAEKSNVELGTYGCGAHCDYGMLTLLATDDEPGLQVCKNKDEETVWEDVPPMKGAFIVNLGDMVEMWSNGLFCSPLHRVVGQGVERYSVPFFFHLNYDCLVECLPTCCSEDNPPKYLPITCEGHMMNKFYPVVKEGSESGEIQVARSK